MPKEKIKEANIKGWQFLIEIKGIKEHSISFVGNKINIDHVWYKISSNKLKKLTEIYNELDYKEECIK
ncbi:hypothetical protein [Clostridium sp. Marseille-Q2269]|uniref:hypothetical protein n=1 Tax=Clostridium sp. Marseille-Q2269 TaxID=2942205 RepID=UPI0020730804|nr:hypothetical protein [Clostridium sp. Marseille-Q2269]